MNRALSLSSKHQPWVELRVELSEAMAELRISTVSFTGTRNFCLMTLAGLAIVVSAHSQTTLIVSDQGSSAFSVILGAGETTMMDPLDDQQTGQGADDMVSSLIDPGFWIGTGLIGGAEAVAFRFQLDKVDNKTEFSGNLRLGLDIEGDDDVDFFIGPKLSGNAASQGVVFQLAGAGLNDAPNTTSLGDTTDIIAFTADNYNYAVQTDVTNLFGGDSDALLTFAVTFAQLNAYIASAWGTFANMDQTGSAPTLGTSSVFRFVAFTSTQSNAINQDLFGVDGIPSVRFSEGNGFSLPTYGDGTSAVPEPSTFFITGILLGLPWMVMSRRRSNLHRVLPALPAIKAANS
jgi:hypothetical protein